MKNQKWVFLQALILTLIVFNIGIYLGYNLESSRIDSINQMYLESETNLLDQRIQKEAFELIDLNCEKVIQYNIDFADRIFEEAQVIQKFEDANKLNENINFQHTRFDLLRTLFWMNSIKIKQKCKANFHNIVYFYNYPDPSINEKAEQRVFSNLLQELKQKYGDEIMLIPISANKDAPSIQLLLEEYDVKIFPSVLIDEKIKLESIEELQEIEKYLN